MVTISLPAPAFAPEPATTPGTENTVSWAAASEAAEYLVECDDDPLFESPDGNSGWITETQHTFDALADGETYYYRVKARTEAPVQVESNWSDAVVSTQDASPPTVLRIVASDALLTDADVGATTTLTVTFDEAMDPSFEPQLSFAPDHQGSLLNGVGAWSQTTYPNDTFTVTYEVVDLDVEISDVAVDAVGAKDLAGNDQQDYEPEAEFGINTLNLAPEDMALDTDRVDENQPVGTLVGTFSTTDPDTGDTFTYELIAGEGDNDNAAFTVDGDQLKTAAEFNHEMQDSYSIRVATTDSGGLTYEEEIVITVNDLVENMLLADANDDGTVDKADAARLSANWGTPSGATWRMGDFNLDGSVNIFDAAILAANWGATAAPEAVEPEVSDSAPFVGPLPASHSALERTPLSPASRDAGATEALLMETEAAEAAVDAALGEAYSPEPEATGLRQRQIIWSATLARRQSNDQASKSKDQEPLAIDLILSDPEV
jgi:hypothetical protein